VRHARASRASVSIRREPAALVVEVRDDGGVAGGRGQPGFGLRGMAERVDAQGGTLAYGPVPGGGWRVTATLPCAPSSPGAAAADRAPTRSAPSDPPGGEAP
jgi:signal transduction histidine kinase